MENEKIYYAVALAASIGIVLVLHNIYTSEPPQENFTELYFQYERIPFEKEDSLSKTIFKGVDIYLNVNEAWIDLNGDKTKEDGEILFKGDSFLLYGKDYNITDFTETEILLGAYPKERQAGSLTFSFFIVNHLGKENTYDYTMFVDDTPLQKGRIDVGIEEKKLLTLTVEIKENGKHKVSVKLSTGEEIYFWVTIS